MTTLEGSTQFAELLAKNVRLEREKHTLSQALATAIRDRDRMALTLTGAQALASRQHDHIVALKNGAPSSFDASYHSDIKAIREVLGAADGEKTVDAAKRVAGAYEAQTKLYNWQCDSVNGASNILGRVLGESLPIAAARCVNERNDAVAGLAKVSAELEIAKADAASKQGRLNEFVAATNRMRSELENFRRETVPVHHDEIEGRRGGVL